MPLTYRIDQQQGFVTITGDYADADEWMVLLTVLGEDPRFRSGLNFVRDLRGAAHHVDVDTVIRSVGIVREFWDRLGARRAAIITEAVVDNATLIVRALARHLDMPVRLFTSYDDAVTWLRESEDRQSPGV